MPRVLAVLGDDQALGTRHVSKSGVACCVTVPILCWDTLDVGLRAMARGKVHA